MTGITGVAAVDMIDAFTLGNTVVMATEAGADHLAVIHGAGGHRRPTGREYRMTGIAVVRAVNVRTTLAAGGSAVMAGETVVNKAGMIHRSRQPGIAGVAIAAVGAGGYVVYRFACGDTAVMAALAGTVYMGMIHGKDRGPGSRRLQVTGITGVAAIDMTGTFATGHRTVMATETSTNHLGVIHGTGR